MNCSENGEVQDWLMLEQYQLLDRTWTDEQVVS
jgi:hypothetical protein